MKPRPWSRVCLPHLARLDHLRPTNPSEAHGIGRKTYGARIGQTGRVVTEGRCVVGDQPPDGWLRTPFRAGGGTGRPRKTFQTIWDFGESTTHTVTKMIRK
jgi:hypothetical protein